MFTRQDVEDRAKDARELLRARELISRARVLPTCFEGEDFCAIVHGTDHRYDVRVTPALDGSSCTCMQARMGARGFCKHVAAAALVWLDEDVDPATADPNLAEAIAALNEGEARLLLMDFAGRSEKFRQRIVRGTWSSPVAEPETRAKARTRRAGNAPTQIAAIRIELSPELSRALAEEREGSRQSKPAPISPRRRRGSKG